MQRSCIPFFLFFSLSLALEAQQASFADRYPSAAPGSLEKALGERGILDSAKGIEALDWVPSGVPDLDPKAPFRRADPTFVVESLRIIPYSDGEGSLLEAYAALSRVRNLAGLTYRSSSRGKEVPLFEEATRIEGPRKTNELPDPVGPAAVPPSETVYLRLKDANFGNSYYRSDLLRIGGGLRFALTNNRSLSYGPIPVIGEGKFISTLYVEPLQEGLLVYGIAAAEVSSFVSSRVNIPSAIRKRLEVIVEWLAQGI